jgi:hypothetical protein
VTDEDKLKYLYPYFSQLCRKIIMDVPGVIEGYSVRIIEGFRSTADQEARWDLGRTKPGDKITFAPPGYSKHEYGLAADFVFVGKDPYLTKDPKGKGIWLQFADYIRTIPNLKTGADFKSITDYPHVELDCGVNIHKVKSLFEQAGIEAVWQYYDTLLIGGKNGIPS